MIGAETSAAWLTTRAAAQRIGVQRPAIALTGPDPATEVWCQTATKVD